MADVDHHHAARREVLADQGEELLGDQVERDVGLAVGVDHDRVPAPVGRAQERARVGRVQVQVRAALRSKSAAPDVGQLAVDLDAVDARAGEEVAVGARGRPGGVAEDRDRARRPAGGEGQHQELVPVVAGQPPPGPVDRVDRLALVELQLALAVGPLDDPGVLVLGLAARRSPGPRRTPSGCRPAPPAGARHAAGASA